MTYAPFDRMSPYASALIADGVCGALLALWILALVLRAVTDLSRARDALANVATRLRPGVITLRGRVCNEPGLEGSPVSVTIHQVGEQQQGRNGSYVLWREVRRDTRARPFYLVLASGERLRVEAKAEQLRLVDDLSVSERAPGANARTRGVSVHSGQELFVRGEVQRGVDPHGEGQGYREAGARALVMAPASDGLLISSRPVDRDHRRRASYGLLFAAMLTGFLGVMQLAVFEDYRVLRRRGVVSEAVVTGRSRYTTQHKGARRVHYVLEAQLEDGTPVRDEVSQAAWTRATPSSSIQFTVARGGRVVQVGGGEVGIHRPAGVAAVMSLVGLAVLYVVGASARRGWFDRRKLIESEAGTL